MSTRRQFCAEACRAALVTGALGPVAACGGSGSSSPSGPSGSTGAQLLTVISGSVSGNTVVVSISASSPLASVGGLALVQAGANQILVARTGTSTFNAVTAICTHEACVITGFLDTRYVCPCHGSVFDTAGRVLTAPAPTPLRAFATAFSGTQLTVTL